MTTPKTNGASTSKAVKDSAAKSAKPKTKKAIPKVDEVPEIITPAKELEPEPTPEEKRVKKEVKLSHRSHFEAPFNDLLERNSIPSAQTSKGSIDQRSGSQGRRDEADV